MRLLTWLPVLSFALPVYGQSLPSFTPAPLNVFTKPLLAGGIPDLRSGLVWDYDYTNGEVFLWNSSDETLPLISFTLACDAGCLDPVKHVDLATQALSSTQNQAAYADAFGPGALTMVSDLPTSSQISGVSSLALLLPPGFTSAFSLGEVMQGTASQVADWAFGGVISLNYTTPEPPAIGIAGLAAVGLGVCLCRKERTF